jgi:hypothetical protein
VRPSGNNIEACSVSMTDLIPLQPRSVQHAPFANAHDSLATRVLKICSASKDAKRIGAEEALESAWSVIY